MKTSQAIRRHRKRSVKFKPTRDFIREAVFYYLSHGGKITKLEFDEKSFKNFIAGSDSPIAVDEFLKGN